MISCPNLWLAVPLKNQVILESAEIHFAATKNQSLAARSFAGILERLIARAIIKICSYVGYATVSFGLRGLLALPFTVGIRLAAQVDRVRTSSLSIRK